MRFARILVLLSAIALAAAAKAHVVGSSPWCLANSPVHYECYLAEQDRCESEAKRRSNVLEQWQCVPFPMDFRNIPKSGEGPVQKEKPPSNESGSAKKSSK